MIPVLLTLRLLCIFKCFLKFRKKQVFRNSGDMSKEICTILKKIIGSCRFADKSDYFQNDELDSNVIPNQRFYPAKTYNVPYKVVT